MFTCTFLPCISPYFWPTGQKIICHFSQPPNMNDDFYKDFEVCIWHFCKTLASLGFSPKIFFILTSVTSETSWGQTMSFSDLTEVSNFSWRCQLLYEVLFVNLRLKLKHTETTISHWALLDPTPPVFLTDQKAHIV